MIYKDGKILFELAGRTGNDLVQLEKAQHLLLVNLLEAFKKMPYSGGKLTLQWMVADDYEETPEQEIKKDLDDEIPF